MYGGRLVRHNGGSMKFQTVFGPQLNGPSAYYRIPSAVTTKHGTVVLCADARYCSGMDNPNRIDKVVRRSTDGGQTWGGFILAAQEQGYKQMHASAAIDPEMVYVEELDRIYMLYSHTPAGVGIRNSRCSVGEDEQGNRYINGLFQKYILKEKQLFKLNGQATGYYVLPNGEIERGGKTCGNIFTGGRFKEESTSTLMLCYSDDDGKTWTGHTSLNAQVKEKYMSFIGPGPGCGIVLKHGAHKGRIVFSIYYGTRVFPLRLSCCVIYSDDGGKHWKRGQSPNDMRMVDGKQLSSLTIRADQMLTESQLIEQEDGTLKYFMRNHDKAHSIAVAYSKDGGESWEDFHLDHNLPQPVCQTSVLKLTGTEKPTVVLLNPADRKKRENGTVRLSEDDGETFPYSRQLKAGSFVYSTLTQLPNGHIGAAFEPDTACKEILFAEFSTDWIKGN